MKGTGKVFRGQRTPEGVIVTVDHGELDPRWDVRNHSPDGFNWGYGGSGPAQLALAVLCELYGSNLAQAYYQDFKGEFIAYIGDDSWQLQEEAVRNWMENSVLADVIVPPPERNFRGRGVARFAEAWGPLANEGACDGLYGAEFFRLLDWYIDDVMPEPVEEWIRAHANLSPDKIRELRS